MRSGTDWQRQIVGLVEVMVSAAVMLLWVALVRDVDKATAVVAPACATDAARDMPAPDDVGGCNTTAAHEPPPTTPSGKGAAGGS